MRKHEWQPGQIFVFGSNLVGQHHGGAAAFALNHCGAVYGQEQGLQGDSYAIPTCFLPGGIPALSLDEIKAGVDCFTTFAKYRDGLYFFVTAIGTGIVGYRHDQIAPMFTKLPNIIFPPEWDNLIK